MSSLTQKWSQIDPGQAAAALLRRAPPWICALLLILIAWQLAGLTWTFVAGPRAAPDRSPLSAASPLLGQTAGNLDVRRILDTHLFGQAAQTAQAAPAVIPETQLNLRLRGVMFSDDPTLGFAIIADDRGQEQVYRTGQTLSGGVRLNEVYADQVVISRNGILETLRLPRNPSGGASAGGSPATTAQSSSTAAAPSTAFQAAPSGGPMPSMEEFVSTNITRILEVIRLQPYLEGGQMRGYQLFPGPDEQLFLQLGLRAGDIVTAIEGMPLSDPTAGLEIFSAFGQATRVNVTLERQGVSQDLTLDTEVLSRIANGVAQ